MIFGRPPETVLWSPVWLSGELLDLPLYGYILEPLKAPRKPVCEPGGACVGAGWESRRGCSTNRERSLIFQLAARYCNIDCMNEIIELSTECTCLDGAIGA